MNNNILELVEKLFDDDIFNNEHDVLSELNIDEKLSKIQYIDLGLPSGLLWGDRNVGAKNINDPGLYVLWGRIDGILDFDEDYLQANTLSTAHKEYGYNKGEELLKEDDIAYLNDKLGRIPTVDEIKELITHTTLDFTDDGVIFKGKDGNGNSIFIPIHFYFYQQDLTNYFGKSDDCESGIWSSTSESPTAKYALKLDSSWDDVLTLLMFGSTALNIRPVYKE